MSIRISKIAAVAALAVASPGLFTRSLSAQPLPINDQPYAAALQRGPIEYLNGTKEGCRVYSFAAQSQAGDNLRFSCGYTGARWDENPVTHYWWCRLIQRHSTIVAELRNRETDLQRCVSRFQLKSFRRQQPISGGNTSPG